ncbi:MAG: prepilin-type N-terminal cleavage/methylation domain-containing protein [Rhodanobacter sp.]
MNASRPSRAGLQHGFSLLEVIAAIMLLAIAFTALMKVAGASISLSQNAAAHSEAALYARSLLDTAFVNQAIKPGSSSGQFDQRFRWKMDVTRWDPPVAPVPSSPLPGTSPTIATMQLYQLDLNVLWGSPARPYSAHFRTLRLGSPSSAGFAAGNAQARR